MWNNRSSQPRVFLAKAVLKICNKFTGEHPCRSAVSIKLQSNLIEITLRHGRSPVNLLHIFRTPFPKNTSRQLPLWDICFSHASEKFHNFYIAVFLKNEPSKWMSQVIVTDNHNDNHHFTSFECLLWPNVYFCFKTSLKHSLERRRRSVGLSDQHAFYYWSSFRSTNPTHNLNASFSKNKCDVKWAISERVVHQCSLK